MGWRLGILCTFLWSAPVSAGTAWQEIAMPGMICARGAPFSIFVRPGLSNKLAVDFAGGGACGDAASCDVQSNTYVDSVDELRQLLLSGALGGVFDDNPANNPVNDWTHVLIPYCTGDLHWGSADVTYTRADRSSFVIHHRGASNVRSALNWVQRNYPTAERVLAAGCSAGSYASIYWTPAIRQAYPRATMQQFGDSGAGIQEPGQPGSLGLPVWNITAAAPAWVPGLNPAQVDYSTLTVNDFYVRIAGFYPNIQFAQVNHAHDAVQRQFFTSDKARDGLWSPLMFSAVTALNKQLPNFHSYIGPSSKHCVLPDADFYQMTTAGVKFNDWFKRYIQLGPYENVSCSAGQCG